MVRTVIEFIDAKGGPAAMSRATGHSAGAVSVWRHRNRVPRSAWPEIMAAYPEITLEKLKALEAKAPERSTKRPKPQPGAAA